MTAAEKDRQQPHEDVQVGSRWFVWGYHWNIEQERYVNGVRDVLMSHTQGRGKRRDWVPAWRVQRYGKPSLAEE